MPVSSDSKGADEDRTKIVPFASGAEQYRGKKYLKLKTCKWRIFSCQRAGVDLLQTWKQNNPYFSSFFFCMTILLLIFTCMFVLMIANYYKLTSTKGLSPSAWARFTLTIARASRAARLYFEI